MRSLAELWPRAGEGSSATRTAFVLSGGAAMGSLQVGMLRALIERRIHPDVILGCSIGAINGVVLAGGPSLATVGRMQDVWMDLIAGDLVPTGLLPSQVQLLRKGESIASNDGMRDLLARIVPADTFADLQVPFQCVATDIDAGVEAWFDTGEVVPAVLASSAVPAVFPTVEIDGVRYLDGGIVNDVPVRRAVELGANRIYVLQVGALDHPRPQLRRPIDAALVSYWIAKRSRLLDDLARVPDDVEIVMLPYGDPDPVRFDDLSSSAVLMDIAYRASSDHLDALAEGRIEPTFGPQPSPEPTRRRAGSEEGAFAAAQRLFAAARELVGRTGIESRDDGDEETAGDGVPVDGGASPVGGSTVDPGGEVESRGSLLERAEAVGPAMRALITRIFEREASESRFGGDDDSSRPGGPHGASEATAGPAADTPVADRRAPGDQSAEK